LNAYVDSSVLIRVVLGQPNRLRRWSEISNAVSSELVRVEMLRTIDRVATRGGLTPAVAADRRSAALEMIGGLSLAPISTIVLERAADPFPTPIGTLDAIHLATALLVRVDHPDLEFATHDVELALAARSVGFVIHGA
jgi:predicted nucleic acid-binding protein